jgi:signal peptidase II
MRQQLFWSIACIIFAVDRLSKWVVVTYNLPYTLNKGAAFGILQGQRLFFIIVSVLFIAILIWQYKEILKHKSFTILTALLLGGTFGNLYDRVLTGVVIDFIDVGFWPSFNIADTALTIGVIGLIIAVHKKK